MNKWYISLYWSVEIASKLIIWLSNGNSISILIYGNPEFLSSLNIDCSFTIYIDFSIWIIIYIVCAEG